MFTSTQAVAIAGDIVSGVRADVSLASLHSLGTFTGNNRKPDIQLVDGRLWAASPFGVVAWNPADGSYSAKTVADGLLSNNVKAIGAEPSGDTLWFGSDMGVNSYTQSTGQWRSYTATHRAEHDQRRRDRRRCGRRSLGRRAAGNSPVQPRDDELAQLSGRVRPARR